MVLFVCLHIKSLIIIILQANLKVLNFWNASQVHSDECVSKITSILSTIFRFLSHFPCDHYVYFILLSNLKYEPLAIV